MDFTTRFNFPKPDYGEYGETASDNFANAQDEADTTIGTEIDNHINDADNPHSVTASQVGLANVTNDAQLKRADNDWTEISEESTPDSNDYVIIEKTTTGAKRKVLLGNLPTAGEGEANTASNQGVGGVGIYHSKVGIDLQFKNINAGSTKITVIDDTDNKEIDIDVDPAEISHTAIADIGTNTHAQIDTHIADTANPHSVTNTQVGLANVTNNAQLTRSSGDINSFTEKTSPIGADVMLIEDSADDFAKKKVQLTNLGYATSPATNTDNAIARWDGADSATLQDSDVTIDDDGNVNIPSDAFYKVGGDIYYPKYVFHNPHQLADDDYQGRTFNGQAGENLTQWDFVYLNSDGKWYKAKADSATTCPAVAVVVAAVNANEWEWLLYEGFFRDDGGVTCTVGNPIFLSEATAGAMADAAPSTSGNQVQILGLSLTAQIRKVNPNMVTLEIA